jgi:hypothetical protein
MLPQIYKIAENPQVTVLSVEQEKKFLAITQSKKKYILLARILRHYHIQLDQSLAENMKLSKCY